MEIRKFEALSMQDALKAVKREFGHDAIIVKTQETEKTIPQTGQIHKMIEVYASPPVNTSVINSKSKKEVKKYPFPVLAKTNTVSVIKQSPEKNYPLKNNTTENNPLIENMENLQKDWSRFKKELKTLPHWQINQQMQEMKMLLFDMMQKQQSENPVPKKLLDTYTKLKAAGIRESFLAEMINSIQNQNTANIAGQNTEEEYIAQCIKYILKNFSIDNNPLSGRISCFIGPTGVGKTTTVAKLAHYFKDQNPLILGFDNIRLAASQQLRVYARILEIPFLELTDGKDLGRIAAQNESKKILIDTAGLTAKSIGETQWLQELRQAPVPIDFHLVLSSTMKERDIEEMIRSCGYLKSLLFTKLDESWSYGEIFNSSQMSHIPLSFFTHGQNLNKDIEVATKERVIERIFFI